KVDRCPNADVGDEIERRSVRRALTNSEMETHHHMRVGLNDRERNRDIAAKFKRSFDCFNPPRCENDRQKAPAADKRNRGQERMKSLGEGYPQADRVRERKLHLR